MCLRQVAQLERQLAASKEAMEGDIRARAAEADALKGVVDELRNATCHTIAGSEAAILALQVDYRPSSSCQPLTSLSCAHAAFGLSTAWLGGRSLGHVTCAVFTSTSNFGSIIVPCIPL